MSRRKEVLHRPACDSRPANQTFMEMLDSNRQEYEARMALAKENTILKARIAELEAENQRLRDGISLHRADTKMRAGSLWGASQEDATLWALLGGGENV